MNTGCAGRPVRVSVRDFAGGDRLLPRPSRGRSPSTMMLKMLSTEPRWVSCAPFGKPVVPEV